MKKGISLVSLMITIVIIVLLTTTVTISATSSINNSRKINFANEISFIQEKVNNYYLSNNSLPLLEKINLDEEYLTNINSNYDEVKELYKLDLSKLGKLETVYGNGKNELDFYAIDINTNEVYYLAGVSIGETRYYSLTDELKTVIRYSNNSLNDNIIFNKMINKWTNENIITEVLIPNEYTNITVSVFKSEKLIKNVTDFLNNGRYNKYVIDGVSGNYEIKVDYEKNDTIKSVSFKINNFDDTKPSYKIADKKVFDNGNEKYYYIEIYDVFDNLSGVSKIKFLKLKATLDEIRKNGISIQNNIMEFDESTEFLTLYIEDNAGNYIYEIIDVREELNE